MTITHQMVETNGIRLHIASAGEGLPVVFCHGFPGLWYSWRNQLEPVAAAGFRAIAVDQRGYGRSDRPVDPAEYDANQVMDDMIGLLDALGAEKAVFVGHDFGAQQVCNLAVRHPDRVAGVVIMACPYDFDLAGRAGQGSKATAEQRGMEWGGGMRPTEAFALAARRTSPRAVAMRLCTVSRGYCMVNPSLNAKFAFCAGAPSAGSYWSDSTRAKPLHARSTP